MSHSRILVPLDGSDIGEAALDQARKMVSGEQVELKLLHAWDHHLMGDEVSDPNRMKKVREEHLAYLTGHTEKLIMDGISASSSLLEKAPTEAILQAAKEENIDLIVMTSHGRSGLSRLVMGSVAEEVVRAAPCPVLVLGREYLNALSAASE